MRNSSSETVFIISIWLEALTFGLFLCLFLGSLYVKLTLRVAQSDHNRVMFYISVVMFCVALLHLSVNCYRLVQGYVIHAEDPVAYIQTFSLWHHVLKGYLFIIQEFMGDAAAVYRTWVIWDRNWKPIMLSLVLLIFSGISGVMLCVLSAAEVTGSVISVTRVKLLIFAFNISILLQSCLTTSLMAWRIWKIEKQAQRLRMSSGYLYPVIRILIESASLQFIAQLILLGLFSVSLEAQYIMLESIIPLVGITFNAITIRIALYSQDVLEVDTMHFSTCLSDVGRATHNR